MRPWHMFSIMSLNARGLPDISSRREALLHPQFVLRRGDSRRRHRRRALPCVAPARGGSG